MVTGSSQSLSELSKLILVAPQSRLHTWYPGTGLPGYTPYCIKVDFCAGHGHDVTMDDELDEGDFDGSDDMDSGDEMDF